MTDEDWSLEPPQPWMARSICPSVDPELFFPPKSRSDRARWAKWVCAQCPPVDDCRRYALDHPELDGVWGATTERERRTLRKEGPAMTWTCAICGDTTDDPIDHARVLHPDLDVDPETWADGTVVVIDTTLEPGDFT